MIILLIAFVLLNIALAFVDAKRIIKSKNISHVLNAAVYLGFIAIPFFLFKNYWMIGAILFIRLTVFNIALSKFRGLKWDYVSPMPAAITDRMARAVFGANGALMYGIYAAILTGLLIMTFIM